MAEINLTVRDIPFGGRDDRQAGIFLWMTIRPLDTDPMGGRLMTSLRQVDCAYVDEETDNGITYMFDRPYADILAELRDVDPMYADRFPTMLPESFKDGTVRLSICF